MVLLLIILYQILFVIIIVMGEKLGLSNYSSVVFSFRYSLTLLHLKLCTDETYIVTDLFLHIMNLHAAPTIAARTPVKYVFSSLEME